MRLFGTINSLIDRFDRAGLLTPPFDINWGAVQGMTSTSAVSERMTATMAITGRFTGTLAIGNRLTAAFGVEQG